MASAQSIQNCTDTVHNANEREEAHDVDAGPKGKTTKVEHLDVLADKAFVIFMSTLLVTQLLDLQGLVWPASPQCWENFLLLWVPGLVGNYASLPVIAKLSEKLQPRKKPVQLYRASLIVGNFNWLVMIPIASWLVAPCLPRQQASTHWTREVFKAVLHLILSEMWFYAIHWCCHHSRFVYKHVHSHHHRINDPHVLNASYQHPLEMFLITMGTIWVGAFVLPSHAATIAWQGVLIMVAGNYGHSGMTSIHDDHHRCPKGRYGFCYFTDMLLRTYHFDGESH